MEDKSLILSSLIAYLAIVALVGILSRRFITSSDDFFRAGGSMPWWIAGISLYMGSFSAFAFVAFGSVAYNNGMMGVLVGMGGILGWILSAQFFAHKWRRANIATPTTYLERRFGAKTRQAIVWLNVLLSPLQSGLRLYAFAIMVHGIMGYPLIETIIFTALVMLAYSSLGGLWAVVLTDTIQFIIMLVGVVPLAILSIIAVGGLDGLVDLKSTGFFSPERSQLTFWWLITWWVTEIINTLASFQGVQRFSAVPSDKDAKRAAFLAAGLLVPTVFLILIPSLLGAHIYPDMDGQLIFAKMTTTLLPAGVIGLMLGAMCAATMSSLDSIFNVDAALMTNDVYKRLINKNASARRLLTVSRITTLIAVTLATSVAVVLAALNLQTFSVLEVLQSRFLIIIWTFFILGIIVKSASTRSFLAALAVSFGFSAFLLIMDVPLGDSRFWIIIVSIISFTVFGRLWPMGSADQHRVDIFFQQLEQPSVSVEKEEGNAMSAKILNLLGASLLCFSLIPGFMLLVRSGSIIDRATVIIEGGVFLSLVVLGGTILAVSRRKT